MLFPIARLVPSAITVMALCLGMLSVKASLVEQWEKAMLLILAAGILDALDGKVARMLRVDSAFGAQLDSLCDLVNFGICPALVVYMWGLSDIRISGWALVMMYVACMALRLARFNATALGDKKDNPMQNFFFTGVPAPAGATLLLLPVIVSLSAHYDDVFDQRFSPLQVQFYMFLVSLLLVSPIPTFSLKALHISKQYVPLALACFALFFICLMFKPWITLPVICVSYVMSIPCSAILSFYLNRLPKS